jgi:hypothetical protein
LTNFTACVIGKFTASVVGTGNKFTTGATTTSVNFGEDETTGGVYMDAVTSCLMNIFRELPKQLK